MSDAVTSYDEVFVELLNTVPKYDLSTNEATTSIKNLRVFSDCRPPNHEPKPETVPEPITVLDKIKVGLNGVWESETTRVLLKTGGAFAGVALVTWATVHRDHVVTSQALSQANQRFG